MYALAMFRDVSRAAIESYFGAWSAAAPPPMTVGFAKGPLKTLFENDEESGYGYACGNACIKDVRSQKLRNRNAIIYSSKSLEIGSRMSRGELFLHLWHPVELDLHFAESMDNPNDLFASSELTPGTRQPGDPRNSPSDLLLSLKNAGGNWSYWYDWYRGFLTGDPLDWNLQRQVALISVEKWESGPEAVAAEIERIRAEFNAPPPGKERFPKHEPKSVSHLFENRIIATASLQGLAAQVTNSIERFHAETGANALPEALEPLAALPPLLLAVNSTLQQAPSDGPLASETEDQLRAEIGRLNAKVAQLENELQKANAAEPSVFSDAFKKQLGTSLGDWKLYAALCTGLWFVSGDIEGTQRRLENISHYRDMIFGDVSSPSKTTPSHSAAAESMVEI
ncbi:hypothetical protein N6L27_09760 [Leisingera sp. SS27]|uniref:hypothetical protein n=1 Tax=Leisingera sp. SS27 TaxID=2979462 RepID=UPI00232EF0D6|nr:hypothetical protein [Leisingera sp. SS27]MDC0658281.1 hypothetical protein [Leisingera sp. SS27]